MTRDEAKPGAVVVRVNGRGEAKPGVYMIVQLTAKMADVKRIDKPGAWYIFSRLSLLRPATAEERIAAGLEAT